MYNISGVKKPSPNILKYNYVLFLVEWGSVVFRYTMFSP